MRDDHLVKGFYANFGVNMGAATISVHFSSFQVFSSFLKDTYIPLGYLHHQEDTLVHQAQFLQASVLSVTLI